jgi:uncharacterized protein (DUF58 family)
MNTGNNGLFLVSALLLGSLGVSGFVSRRNVWRLEARLDPSDGVHALRPESIPVRLAGSGRGTSRSIRVDPDPETASGAIPEPRDGGASRFLLTSLPSGRSTRFEAPRFFERRGAHDAGRVEVESRFPFGFFRKSRRLTVQGELLVWPALVPLPDRWKEAQAGEEGGEESRRKGRSSEFDDLRDFRSGDDARDVHWKVTARRRRLTVKQRLSEGRGATTIVLDPGPVDPARFERIVSAAASYAELLLARGGAVGLVCGEVQLPPGAGPVQRKEILDFLARVELPGTPRTGSRPEGGRIVRAEELLE